MSRAARAHTSTHTRVRESERARESLLGTVLDKNDMHDMLVMPDMHDEHVMHVMHAENDMHVMNYMPEARDLPLNAISRET